VTKHIYAEDQGARPSSAGRLPSASWNPTRLRVHFPEEPGKTGLSLGPHQPAGTNFKKLENESFVPEESQDDAGRVHYITSVTRRI
jgi:hypothetical protein